MNGGCSEADPGPSEIYHVRHSNDQQPVEVRVVGEMLEQGSAVGADMADLHRPDASHRLESGLVGVE